MPTMIADPMIAFASIDGLAGIRDPHVALAQWQRVLPPMLASELDALRLDTIEDVELTADLPLATAPLAANLALCGYPTCASRLLAEDIALLAAHLVRLTGSARATIKLHVVETDACRRFHADSVTLRLLCTYLGRSTQWVRSDTPDAIEDIATGDVAILKGRLLLDPPTILHRSPPIAGSGEQRLLLTIDSARRD